MEVLVLTDSQGSCSSSGHSFLSISSSLSPRTRSRPSDSSQRLSQAGQCATKQPVQKCSSGLSIQGSRHTEQVPPVVEMQFSQSGLARIRSGQSRNSPCSSLFSSPIGNSIEIMHNRSNGCTTHLEHLTQSKYSDLLNRICWSYTMNMIKLQ